MKPIETGIILASFICAPAVASAEEAKSEGPFVLPLLEYKQDREKAQPRTSKPQMRPDEPGDYCDFSPLTG